jgi:hypothetical protein
LRKGGERRPRRQRSGGPRGQGGRRDAVVETIEIDGELGSHAVEALRLEIRRLAERCGLDIKEIRIETVTEGSGKHL